MSNHCACVWVNVDCFSDVFSERHPVARKNHWCCECGGVIQKGEKYEHHSGQWDGEWQVFKTCLDCADIKDRLFCEGYIYTTVVDDLINHIQDVQGDISEECLLSLRPKAREMVLGLIDEFVIQPFLDEEDG